MQFLSLAKKLDAELVQQGDLLADRSTNLDKKASELARLEASLEEKRKEVESFERQMNIRNEEVTRKEINVRRDEEVREDLVKASGERDIATRERKTSQEALDEAKQALAEVAKRELALSVREKTYKTEIRNKIAEHSLGITI